MDNKKILSAILLGMTGGNAIVDAGNEEYLSGYQIAYSNRSEKMAKEMASERGVNEELYNQDSLEWSLETEKIQEEIRVTLAEEICK